jgi:GNAT superfamily N-acetyltransferase
VSGVRFPAGYRLERLARSHRRREFTSGQERVDDWLATKALQQQDKRLSATKVLLDGRGRIAGYYTLATGQVDFGDLPTELARKLPHRLLPVAVLAWLGVAKDRQGQGLGRLLLAQALADCFAAGQSFPFVAVILDCVDDAAKAFYKSFDFAELPGHPFRLFLSTSKLEMLMRG